MYFDQDLDPNDIRLLTAILDALESKGERDASVVEDFGKNLAGDVDYAAVARWRHGAWVAEVRLVHEASTRCGKAAQQGFRIETEPGFDRPFADLDDLPDPRL
jgi:hypothetical protein